MRVEPFKKSGEVKPTDKVSKIERGETSPKTTKFVKRDDGSLVKLRRVRRKKSPAEAAALPAHPEQLQTPRGVTTTSELGKPAPIQAKPEAVYAKKGRYRSITPGTANLVKKSTPPPHARPLHTKETIL